MNYGVWMCATIERDLRRVWTTAGAALLSGASLLALAGPAGAQAVCPVTQVSAGLQSPQSIVQSNLGNLLVAESGRRPANTGRISIVDLDGDRRTLLQGLPSGIGDVGDPSGPAGLFMRGRTLFALIAVGDAILNGPLPGSFIANPHPSSPIFSSVLAIHFSAHVEQYTEGFTLSRRDQRSLAAGETLTLSNGGSDRITIELVADFPDYTLEPLPSVPANVRGSNPFALVAVGNQLYVTDGAQNQLRQVDISTGDVSTIAAFPPIANPLPVGPPLIDAVPTGIAHSGGQLLVTLFTGVPFAPDTSSVVQVDPSTGAASPFITGLTTAIGVVSRKERGKQEYLVLQSASGSAPFFSGPGVLFRFGTPGIPTSVVADCLEFPTAMVLDESTNTLYVTQLAGGLVSIDVGRKKRSDAQR